jgi:heat shock protein HspQ
MSGSEGKILTARFSVGDLVKHKLFDYRGVVIDVDPEFQSTEEWYETVARTRPPKDKPWYHVLVHKGSHQTYVAERNLEPDSSGELVEHPMIGFYFARFRNGHYENEGQAN